MTQLMRDINQETDIHTIRHYYRPPTVVHFC